tara:strand:+ start:2125 stop:2424 length:300 start_codon:yes stop_codon:yes gene_type:complete
MAPVRSLNIVTLARKEAEHKFLPNNTYKSSATRTVSVYMNVLSRTSDQCIMIKAVEGDALDQGTLTTLEQSPVKKVSLFTDKNNAEYTYVLARRIRVEP